MGACMRPDTSIGWASCTEAVKALLSWVLLMEVNIIYKVKF